jgi:hypothetical protein
MRLSLLAFPVAAAFAGFWGPPILHDSGADAAAGSTQHVSCSKRRLACRERLLAPAGYAAYCGGAPDCPPGHVPAALRRRLHLPVVKRGAPCPVSAPGRIVSPYSAAAIGDGPLYAISLFSLARSGVLPFEYPPRRDGLFPGSSWGGQVLKWIGDPAYTGPALIRGRQLDGRHRLGFARWKIPYSEMQLAPGMGDPAVGGWRGWPGYVRLRAPGCYGLQVDGTSFSEAIVFKAVLMRAGATGHE